MLSRDDNDIGRGLAAEDLNGKSDPFMKITAGKGWKRKTKVRKETLTPKWTDAIYELEYDKAPSLSLFIFFLSTRGRKCPF